MFYNCLFIATSGYLARHSAGGSNTDRGSKKGVLCRDISTCI
ncbi:MAG TPA: hypothetical protein VFC05_10365 [Nitrososphaeraceae archaeon]|nr:hypothetical protein [Nitrososphaeraceae archaeon]